MPSTIDGKEYVDSDKDMVQVLDVRSDQVHVHLLFSKHVRQRPIKYIQARLVRDSTSTEVKNSNFR